MPTTTHENISVDLPEPFTPTWNRLDGISVEGCRLSIDIEKFFYRYENPTWLLCPWPSVEKHLLASVERPETTIEQLVCDYVRHHGTPTTNPVDVLHTAWQVYQYTFREEHLQDPELDFVPDNALKMLRECGTLMALNRVELDGHISIVSPAWMLCIAMEVVYDLDSETAQLMDELYHGTWFNEYRRRESLLAHAALGGRLVHGCQGAPNMSGGVVVPFGTDMTRFRRELSEMRLPWIAATRANHEHQ